MDLLVSDSFISSKNYLQFIKTKSAIIVFFFFSFFPPFRFLC